MDILMDILMRDVAGRVCRPWITGYMSKGHKGLKSASATPPLLNS